MEFTASGFSIHGAATQPETLRLVGKPSICPWCRLAIDAVYVNAIVIAPKDEIAVQAIFRCPNQECLRLIIAGYSSSGLQRDQRFFYREQFPRFPIEPEIPKLVSEVSPQSCEIYVEADAAEQYGLAHVAGPGYRKSLEFLIKDFVTLRERAIVASARSGVAIDDREVADAQRTIDEVSTTFLGIVIKTRVDDATIRELAARAAWLGNDESHYIRKWTDHDLEDLKRILQTVQFFVQHTEAARRTLERMNEAR